MSVSTQGKPPSEIRSGRLVMEVIIIDEQQDKEIAEGNYNAKLLVQEYGIELISEEDTF